MIVKCIAENGQAALKAGNTYPVVELLFDGREYTYRVIGENDVSPGIFPASCFNVIDARISNSHVFNFHQGKSFTLTHESFSAEDFWEKYFNGESNAVSVYNSVIIPLSKIRISITNIANIEKFSWADVQFLQQNQWCDEQLAIDLAVSKISASSAEENEVELAGLVKSEVDDIRNLIGKLAEKQAVDSFQIENAVVKWFVSNCPSSHLDIFKGRLSEKLKTHKATPVQRLEP